MTSGTTTGSGVDSALFQGKKIVVCVAGGIAAYTRSASVKTPTTEQIEDTVQAMWLARLANTGGPPQAKASASGGDERPEADPPETRTEGSNTAQQTKR